MTATDFPECNCTFTAPPSFEESQVHKMNAFCGVVQGGSVDGTKFIVVAWKPSLDELADLNAGKPVFVSMLGGLPPHFLCTDFKVAVSPA